MQICGWHNARQKCAQKQFVIMPSGFASVCRKRHFQIRDSTQARACQRRGRCPERALLDHGRQKFKRGPKGTRHRSTSLIIKVAQYD